MQSIDLKRYFNTPSLAQRPPHRPLLLAACDGEPLPFAFAPPPPEVQMVQAQAGDEIDWKLFNTNNGSNIIKPWALAHGFMILEPLFKQKIQQFF